MVAGRGSAEETSESYILICKQRAEEPGYNMALKVPEPNPSETPLPTRSHLFPKGYNS